jgi:hypothetical protein
VAKQHIMGRKCFIIFQSLGEDEGAKKAAEEAGSTRIHILHRFLLMLAYFGISYVNNSAVTVWIWMFAGFGAQRLGSGMGERVRTEKLSWRRDLTVSPLSLEEWARAEHNEATREKAEIPLENLISLCRRSALLRSVISRCELQG